jgi:hypothetical protein
MSLGYTASGSAPQGKEKRLGRRVAAEILMQCQGISDGGSFLGRTIDLSQGGLLMKSSNLLNQGTRVTVRFNLPPGSPGIHVEATGMVVRKTPEHQMGIRLLQLSESSHRAIGEFVQQIV